MDDPTRRKRQNDPPVHATSNSRYSIQDPSQQQQPHRRSTAGGQPTEQRFRPAPLNVPPPTGRAMGAGAYGGYYQEPAASFPGQMAQGAISYSADYGQDGRQQQGFGGYTANMMYSVPSAGTQSSVYDPTQQFPSRQPAAMGMMGADVGGAYFSGESTSQGNAAPAALPSQGQPAGAAAVYQQGQMQGYSLPQSQPEQEEPMDDPEYNAIIGEKWAEYQSALRVVFQNVRSGALETASESLLRISNWLLSQVVDLGEYYSRSNSWLP
jgi:hypothetical protein